MPLDLYLIFNMSIKQFGRTTRLNNFAMTISLLGLHAAILNESDFTRVSMDIRIKFIHTLAQEEENPSLYQMTTTIKMKYKQH